MEPLWYLLAGNLAKRDVVGNLSITLSEEHGPERLDQSLLGATNS